MKIEYKRTQSIQLKKLNKGDVFTTDGLKYYIKSNSYADRKEALCVDLLTGESYKFYDETLITPIETKLVIL